MSYSLLLLSYFNIDTTVFFDQTPRIPFFSLFTLVWLLIEGGYYFRAAFILLGSQWIANKVHACR